MEIVLIIIGVCCLIGLVAVIVLLTRPRDDSQLRMELNQSVSNLSNNIENRLKTSEQLNEQKLESIRLGMERNLASILQENSKKLAEIQNVVDEKLQTTLETKMNQSFKLVSEQLEKVYRGLGEMQQVAVGVNDLKKVLSNVKTRGILGEVRLGAILEEILLKEQYEENVATKKGSREVVEFAIRLPGDDGGCVYLPIDAKFPADIYSELQDAYESAVPERIDAVAKQLTARLKQEAKSIREKYVDPPNTTEFAILFLPFEGLYAEAVNRGMIEELQRSYRISLAGPSTMAAILNSLQMGFQTLAIQKRSSEVWKILGAVRTEFDKFDAVLQNSQRQLNLVNNELDKLIGVRTRQIQRTLKDIERIDDGEAQNLLHE
ncbi:MAG: DNA recombination protein RmuC [Clostridia bacterium]|nr:DNA recombination protein RmuC [Clostridia bacterium]